MSTTTSATSSRPGIRATLPAAPGAPAQDHDVLLAAAARQQGGLLEMADARGHQRAQRPALAQRHVDLQAGALHRRHRGVEPAHLGVHDEQDTAGAQVRRRLLEQAVQHEAAVAAGVPGALRAAGRQHVGGRRHVGRVGDDHVEARVAELGEEVAAQGADPHAVEPRVEPRGEHRPPREVDGGDVARAAARRADRQRAAAGAHVEDRRPRADDLLAQRARQHPRVRDGREDAREGDDAHPRRVITGAAALPNAAAPAPPRLSTAPNGEQALVTAQDQAALEALRASFDHERPFTVGLEEELMLLHPETLDLQPRAYDVLARGPQDDERFKPELPAAQLEIALPPAETVGELATGLLAARRELAATAEGLGVLAGAGVHPFAAAEGVLNEGERYEAIAGEFASVARRQLVHGLHVHVAVADPDVALAVYNALREHLPALAALGAGSPYCEGRDTGLASARPMVCSLLPRQGVPPAFASWRELIDAFAWGRDSGAFADPTQWWWEARLHALHGTVEIRVPDTQATVADAVALAAVGHALVVDLAQRAAAGETLGAAPSWRIAENRWSACRHGVTGRWYDVWSGRSEPMADHL